MARTISSQRVVCAASCLRPVGRQPVVLRLAVVVGGAPERRDPAAIFQPVKGRVQGAVLDLEHVLRPALDGVRDGVAVRRAHHEDPQYQHVERALGRLTLQRRFTPVARSAPHSTW